MDNQAKPITSLFSTHITDGKDTKTLYLYIIEYSNALQASIYDDIPKLGSMVMVFPLLDRVERQVIFGGKHDQFATALGQILCKLRNKIVYASINLSRDLHITLTDIQRLIDQYKEIK